MDKNNNAGGVFFETILTTTTNVVHKEGQNSWQVVTPINTHFASGKNVIKNGFLPNIAQVMNDN